MIVEVNIAASQLIGLLESSRFVAIYDMMLYLCLPLLPMNRRKSAAAYSSCAVAGSHGFALPPNLWVRDLSLDRRRISTSSLRFFLGLLH